MVKLVIYFMFTGLGIVVALWLEKSKKGYGRRVGTAVSAVQTVSLVGLIFVLGVGIGANEEVMTSLSSIGISSMLIAVTGMAGSVLFVYFTRKWLNLDRKGRWKELEIEVQRELNEDGDEGEKS